MKICRYDDGKFGLVDRNSVRDVTAITAILPQFRYPFPRHDLFVAALPELRAPLEEAAPASSPIPLSQVSLLSPIANPGKIIAAPVNYRRHLEEVRGDPALHHQNAIHEIRRAGLFLKAPSSVIGASERIAIRHLERRTDHEIELAVVIGKACDNVDRADALSYVAGYCIGLDITVRGPEERSLRKSIDTYTVLGPWLTTADSIADPANLELSLEVNGEIRQRANTRDLIMGISELIEFASQFYVLQPGDVILTGTPDGVGPIRPGDVIRATIQDLGEMTVEVVARESRAASLFEHVRS